MLVVNSGSSYPGLSVNVVEAVKLCPDCSLCFAAICSVSDCGVLLKQTFIISLDYILQLKWLFPRHRWYHLPFINQRNLSYRNKDFGIFSLPVLVHLSETNAVCHTSNLHEKVLETCEHFERRS